MLSVEYLAGFIDGEGSLSLARIPRRGGSPEYCLRISIANTNQGILGEIQKDFGGTLAVNRRGNPRWRTGYSLIWTNAAAAELLRRIGPRLRVKSSNAAALLEFTEHVETYRRTRDRRGRLLPLSEREKELRDSYYERLKFLNAKGPRVTPNLSRGARKDLRPEETRRITLEYLAGFMDGEGSVMIIRSYVRRYGTTQYRSRVTLSNTDRQILEDIRHDYGGIIADQGHSVAGWKDGYQLVWTSGMIRQLLPLIAHTCGLSESKQPY